MYYEYYEKLFLKTWLLDLVDNNGSKLLVLFPLQPLKGALH